MASTVASWFLSQLFPHDESTGKTRATKSRLSRNCSHTRLYGKSRVSARVHNRCTLVLDLDETLVHSTTRPTSDYDFMVNVFDEGSRLCTFYVSCRPHLLEFLENVSQWYNIAIFTASKRLYADPVVDRIDTKGVVRQRYYRQSCTEVAGCFMKDLSKVRADQSKVLLVDNSPVCYSLCEKNAVPICGWVDDPNDTALLDILPFLEQIQHLRDVRSVLALRDRAASLGLIHNQPSSHSGDEVSSDVDKPAEKPA